MIAPMLRSIVMLRGYRRLAADKLDRSITTDIYRLILAEAVRLGLAERAWMIWRAETDEVRELGGVKVVLRRSLRHVPPECLDGDAVLVRGDKKPYLPLLRRGR